MALCLYWRNLGVGCAQVGKFNIKILDNFEMPIATKKNYYFLKHERIQVLLSQTTVFKENFGCQAFIYFSPFHSDQLYS